MDFFFCEDENENEGKPLFSSDSIKLKDNDWTSKMWISPDVNRISNAKKKRKKALLRIKEFRNEYKKSIFFFYLIFFSILFSEKEELQTQILEE